jgi:hypothetical protein
MACPTVASRILGGGELRKSFTALPFGANLRVDLWLNNRLLFYELAIRAIQVRVVDG